MFSLQKENRLLRQRIEDKNQKIDVLKETPLSDYDGNVSSDYGPTKPRMEEVRASHEIMKTPLTDIDQPKVRIKKNNRI